VSETLTSRVVAQVRNTAAVISQSDFALNPSILRSARQIAGADVITYTVNGAILATTLDERRQRSLIATVATPDPARQALAQTDGAVVVRQGACDFPCFVAYARVAARPDTVVAVVAETSDLTAATRAVTRTILLAAALSLLVMILVSQAVARRVTAPLDALVAFTREVSPSDSTRRAPVGDDEIGRLAAAFNDMLDRLDRSRDALVRSEKLALAGLLAARVAHDIRNPLSSMKMQTQLLGSRLGPDVENRSLLDAVLRDILQLESVVRDLIELARPGELKRRPTSLNEVVGAVLQQLSPQLAYRKIAVERTLAGDMPPVNLDVERFRQVLLNVIGNAADAMPTGGTLKVATESGDGGSMLVLDVSDDGVGIDPTIGSRVFDPFVSTKRDGVGLGLVNAKAVVESHGGTIELTSIEPRGTRARIRVPVSTLPQMSESRSPEALHG
jgi:signal transduction histidine kinase